ncbi:IclR family transcriptional regulator [Rhodococcus sp. SGAir0479]|uniref:IclR family transcriptional regulator n=1 Tax=Rhodococcus sp. SGAir0479 TaxID=2567884 RepID=UPI0010CCD5CD|nr:IclR family transcriptional regulator [Rhodococcus sp. SGAir0479]QCQ92768.1 IclR family transcriptional regulator [Rhodococcus sp. SGAir0479]
MGTSVLGKVRLLLGSFDPDSSSLSLSELTRRSGVAKATVHRLAAEMVDLGLLERAGTDYRLGLRLFELGQLVPTQRILRDAALPFLQDLHAATSGTVHLAIRADLDVLYVDKIPGPGSPDLLSRVAGRLPLEVTATGKVLLAFSPTAVFDEVVERGIAKFTPRTVASAALLRGQLERARRDAMSIEAEEVRLGTASAAVPLFAGAGVIGAIGVSTTTARMNVARIAGPLQSAGRAVSRALYESARSA